MGASTPHPRSVPAQARNEELFREKVERVVACSAERKLVQGAEEFGEEFERLSGELRASLSMFMQTQRAVTQLMLLDSVGADELKKEQRARALWAGPCSFLSLSFGVRLLGAYC